jgi:hypothetical protein
LTFRVYSRYPNWYREGIQDQDDASL